MGLSVVGGAGAGGGAGTGIGADAPPIVCGSCAGAGLCNTGCVSVKVSDGEMLIGGPDARTAVGIALSKP